MDGLGRRMSVGDKLLIELVMCLGASTLWDAAAVEFVRALSLLQGPRN